MDAFKPFIAKAAMGSLSRDEASAAFDLLLSGAATPSQIGAFLMALRVRGETVDEIAGAIAVMRSKMITVEAPEGAIDIVGTGGDSSGSYNVSTCAAFIVAGAGVKVAKHGNRALSSRSGSADVLKSLGVKIDLSPPEIAACIAKAGVGFMFAPAHHEAMKHVGPTRVELGTRTIFNLVGPCSNPAGVRRQLLGVFSETWLEPLVQVLQALGSTHVMAVHGADGLDEITTTGPTKVVVLKDGVLSRQTVTPEDIGLKRVNLAELKGGESVDNAAALLKVLNGEPSPYRDIALINAAASLMVAGVAINLAEGAALAAQSIDSGKAKAVLDQLIGLSNG